MFTGIVKELGAVKKFEKIGRLYRLAVECKDAAKSAKTGDSIAINGVCLTVTEKSEATLHFDVMEETIRRSNLISLQNASRVNIEDSLRTGGSLGGHFVLGHVDCVGNIVRIERNGEDLLMAIEMPQEFLHLVVEKGSVAIDGVSLTVGKIKDNIFDLYIIPHTLKATTLGLKRPGDKVNIEFDVIGKYVARHSVKDAPLSGKKDSSLTEEFLKDRGFA